MNTAVFMPPIFGLVPNIESGGSKCAADTTEQFPFELNATRNGNVVPSKIHNGSIDSPAALRHDVCCYKSQVLGFDNSIRKEPIIFS